MTNRSTVNRVILMGRIVKSPRCHTENGERMLCFAIHTIEKIKKNNGIGEQHIEEHKICLPEHLTTVDALNKDALVYVQGRIRTRQHTDEMNVKRYDTDILAFSAEVMDVELLKNAAI